MNVDLNNDGFFALELILMREPKTPGTRGKWWGTYFKDNEAEKGRDHLLGVLWLTTLGRSRKGLARCEMMRPDSRAVVRWANRPVGRLLMPTRYSGTDAA